MTSTTHQENTMNTTEHAENAPIPAEEPEEAQDAVAGTNDDESSGSETDEGLVSKIRKEAARHRTRAKEAETRADAAEARAQAVLDHVLAAECKPYGIAPRALTLAEKDPAAWFGPEGFDRQALVADIRDVAAMFGARKQGHSPYTGTGTERPPKGKTWDQLLSES